MLCIGPIYILVTEYFIAIYVIKKLCNPVILKRLILVKPTNKSLVLSLEFLGLTQYTKTNHVETSDNPALIMKTLRTEVS